MNLKDKHTLVLGTDYAQALRVFIVQAMRTRQPSAYYQIVQLLTARIAQKIHRKDSGEGLKLKLNAEETLALQILIATNDWPGSLVDNVLFHLQSTLPPLLAEELVAPDAVVWD